MKKVASPKPTVRQFGRMALKRPECKQTYVGETSRSLGSRLKEHTNIKAVGEHQVNQGHNIMARDATVRVREDNFWRRMISEAIKIRRGTQR